MLKLPEPLKLQYTDIVFRMEESLKMPYLSFVERHGEACGKILGASMIVRHLLEKRFGPLPPPVVIPREQADAERLLTWGRRVLNAGSLEEVFTQEG